MRNSILLFFCVVSGVVSGQSTWEITADNIDPNRYFGITMANGMVGMISSPEPLKVRDVVLNGAFDNYQRGRVSNILKVFNHVDMYLDINGRRIGSGQVTDMRQRLDMRRAVFETAYTADGKASVRSELMALRHLPYCALHIVTIEALEPITFTAASVIEAPNHLRDVRSYYSEIDRPHVSIPLLTSVALSPSGQLKVAASNTFIFPEKHGQTPRLVHEDWDYNMHLAKFTRTLGKGERYQFAVVATVVASNTFNDPHNEAERLSVFAGLEGINRLRARHESEWAKLWESDILLEGDDMAQRDIRSALYHLYAFVREGSGYSMSPMGLSGLGYNGHVFWDTELWMFPPLLLMHPTIAASLLEYRFNRLEMARRNAQAHGFRGAMFPWESADDGSEDTPVWAITGPFEHHISGCIAWAAWKYYQVTRDREWLATRGYPILRDVADFWVSRVEADADGRYHINNVVAANEWEENVDNDAFTNGIAILSLRYAAQAAHLLGHTPNPEWTAVADRVVIERFPDGVIRENRTFERRMIKQADVNLLSFPLDLVRDPAQMKKDLAYYEPLMSPEGPAMGFSVLAAIYARLGMRETLYDKFIASYKNNELPPFGVIAETAGGTNPYFATGAGGMLQAVMMGIAGLEIADEGILQTQDVALPKQWRSLTIKGVGTDKKIFRLQR
jgi:trehalose/maltose hydrolase-like predicted phosphorylase